MTASSCLASRGRVSARRPTYFSLLRQRNVGKRKATLLSASLYGQPAVLTFRGVSQNSLRSNSCEP